jgi:hypothetical protein
MRLPRDFARETGVLQTGQTLLVDGGVSTGAA